MHCAMLDLSKAFDGINFDILFMNLRKTELPTSIIRLFEYMLRNAFVSISFNGYKGSDLLVGNGAGHGAILSPLLFSFYTNEII